VTSRFIQKKNLVEDLLVLERGSLGPSTVTLMALLYVAICGGEELTVIVSVKLFPATKHSAVVIVSLKIFPVTRKSIVSMETEDIVRIRHQATTGEDNAD
jgi:hypothetical protein